MSTRTKKVIGSLATGACFGTVLTSWLAPKVITWYFNPPVNIGINCSDPIAWALRKLQIAQAVGLIGGAILGLVAFFLWLNRPETVQNLDRPA